MVASWSHLFPAFQQRSQTALRWVSSNKIFKKKISLCFVTLAKVSPFGRNSQCTPPVSQSPRHPRRIRGGTGFSALVSTKVGSTNFSRVARTRVALRTSFTQTDAWRKITFAARAQNAWFRISPNFRRTRAVLISDRCAISTRILCADFAHGGQT